MPPRNYRLSKRRSSLPRLLLGGFGLLTLVVVGVVGTLWLAGVPLNPFAKSVAVDDPFMVRIPINAQPIPAYTRVDRLQLLNPTTGGLMLQRVPPQATVGMSIVGIDEQGSHVESRVESVKNVNDEVVFAVTGGAEVRQANAFSLGGAILNVNAIIGRVVKSDKRAGLGFQESTFFPQGTPEGLTGATPMGMRAITLDATKLTGVHSLGAGDQIDLLANVPVDEKGEMSEVELIAQSAKVLRPVYVRNEVSSSATLMQGNQTKNTPKYEVAIAVNADDVIRLQNAINRQLAITCIAHSMKPPVDGDTIAVTASMNEVRVPVTVRPILAYDVVSRDAFVSPATRSLKTESISKQEADRIGAITSLGDALGSIVRQDIPAGRYLRHADLLNGPPRSGSFAPALRGGDGWGEENSVGTSPPHFSLVKTEPTALAAGSDNARDQPAIPEASAYGSHEMLVSPPHPHPLPRSTEGEGTRFHDGTRFVSMLQNEPVNQTAPSATAVGDRPAITRFIPAGRTAFAIPWSRIYGAEHLQIGDSIDLMASYSLERLRDEEETETRPDGTVIVRKSESLTPRATQRSWEQSFGNRAEPWFVASEAVVVAPVGFPPPASALRALNAENSPQNNRNRDQPGFDGPPVIIAVDARDVEAVATALATRDALFTVAFHSSEPEQTSTGQKLIAIAPESIDAYSELSDSQWQGNRRGIVSRTVSDTDHQFADALTPRQLETFYGRVLKVAKSRGDSFSPDDFLPVGAEPGVASAARKGFTLLSISDREIEGIDAFVTNDRITVLIRGVVKNSLSNLAVGDAGIAISNVVADEVRIARGSLAGQTLLEVSNNDVNRLQAAMARSLTDRDSVDGRSHLVAAGLPRRDAESADLVEASDKIEPFDPLASLKTTQVIIGGRRSVEVFGGPSR